MKTILLVGGGTLGSVNPLLAVAAELKKVSSQLACEFWGSTLPRDREVVTGAGIPFQAIPSGKFRRYFTFRNFIDVPVIAWAMWRAWQDLRRLRPAMVVTAGSYVAVPVAWAAKRLHIPIVLYQQDATLGLANKLIAPWATYRFAVGEVQARLLPQPAAIVGFALRPDLQAGNAARCAQKYGLRADQPTVLLIGGSSGALELNRRFLQALPLLDRDIQVVHITGEGKASVVKRPGYIAIPFTNKALPDLYALATFVVSRAGSNVLAELVALGKPALIVPLPNTHQVQNAAVLEEHGALVRAQADLEPQVFATLLNQTLHSPATLQKLQAAIAHVWDTQGASQLAAHIAQHV